jgi:two-component system KDP operon response regulator KdpE
MTAPLPCILVIDDEKQIHRFLGPALEAAGYRVERAETAAEGVRLAASRSPDAVLLDLGLPDVDGHEVLARIRAFSQVPIIILSARDREGEKIAALDGGADDYVEKPFAVGELLARIRTALRHVHAGEHAPTVVRLPGLVVELLRRQVQVEGADTPLNLSPREWELLAVLARNVGRVLTHAQLLSAVWGPAHVEDVQYLRVYVGQLRNKLGPAARLLITEPGVGYRLIDAEFPEPT